MEPEPVEILPMQVRIHNLHMCACCIVGEITYVVVSERRQWSKEHTTALLKA